MANPSLQLYDRHDWRGVSAHHEAAHSVARIVLGVPQGDTIVSEYEWTSYGLGGPVPAETNAKISMAGPAVEGLYLPERPLPDLMRDWAESLVLESEEAHDDPEYQHSDIWSPMVTGTIVEGWSWAQGFVVAHHAAIAAVASALVLREVVTGDEVRDIVSGAHRVPVKRERGKASTSSMREQ